MSKVAMNHLNDPLRRCMMLSYDHHKHRRHPKYVWEPLKLLMAMKRLPRIPRGVWQ